MEEKCEQCIAFDVILHATDANTNKLKFHEYLRWYGTLACTQFKKDLVGNSPNAFFKVGAILSSKWSIAMDEMSRNSCSTSCVRNIWSDQNGEAACEAAPDFPGNFAHELGFVIVRSTCITSSITYLHRHTVDVKRDDISTIKNLTNVCAMEICYGYSHIFT